MRSGTRSANTPILGEEASGAADGYLVGAQPRYNSYNRPPMIRPAYSYYPPPPPPPSPFLQAPSQYASTPTHHLHQLQQLHHGHHQYPLGAFPSELQLMHEQRRRQRLKRETVLAPFDALPIVTIPETNGSRSSRANTTTASQHYMVTRALPPHPFWENISLLQTNPSILHFLRDFGRCDWMDVESTSMAVRMSSSSLEQLRLTDEVLVQWLRYYDPTLPFWTLFATISTYSGFMVGKLVGHLRNIEANTGAKVWVAPRDPESTFVSFFVCSKTEEATMLAYHALQSREMAALALGEKVGSTEGEAQEEEEVEEEAEGRSAGDDEKEGSSAAEEPGTDACGAEGQEEEVVVGEEEALMQDGMAKLVIGGTSSSQALASKVVKKNEEGNQTEEEGKQQEEDGARPVRGGPNSSSNNNHLASINNHQSGDGRKRQQQQGQRHHRQEEQQQSQAEGVVVNNKEPRGA